MAAGVLRWSSTTQSPTTGAGTTLGPNMARTGPESIATMRPAPSWGITRPGVGPVTSAAASDAAQSSKRCAQVSFQPKGASASVTEGLGWVVGRIGG